jgi:hypothetical protein
MAHWAELNDDNVVIRTIVTDNNDPNGDEGYQWIIDNLGGRWVQTSYNANFRKQYGCVGDIYYEDIDAFKSPQWLPSWIFNEETWMWEAPKPYPDDGGMYTWDESKLDWVRDQVGQ